MNTVVTKENLSDFIQSYRIELHPVEDTERKYWSAFAHNGGCQWRSATSVVGAVHAAVVHAYIEDKR